MKQLQLFTIIALWGICNIKGQEIDIILNTAESGTQTHVARNSITLDAGYSYTISGGTMQSYIVDPVVTGTVSYGSTPVDPETRTLSTSWLVGSTNGGFAVNQAGAASYTIPIEALPGVNGLTPSVSLV
jgi:hypothetical protein